MFGVLPVILGAGCQGAVRAIWLLRCAPNWRVLGGPLDGQRGGAPSVATRGQPWPPRPVCVALVWPIGRMLEEGVWAGLLRKQNNSIMFARIWVLVVCWMTLRDASRSRCVLLRLCGPGLQAERTVGFVGVIGCWLARGLWECGGARVGCCFHSRAFCRASALQAHGMIGVTVSMMKHCLGPSACPRGPQRLRTPTLRDLQTGCSPMSPGTLPQRLDSDPAPLDLSPQQLVKHPRPNQFLRHRDPTHP